MTEPRDQSGKPSKGGRPLKFHEKSRAVTLTLPERILDLLQTIDADRARAVVKVTEATVSENHGYVGSGAELVEVLPGLGMIVLGPCRSLTRIKWLNLAEVAAGRSILVLKSGAPVERLEIEVLEIMENLPAEAERDRPVLQRLKTILSSLRREERVSKGEVILFRTGAATEGRRLRP